MSSELQAALERELKDLDARKVDLLNVAKALGLEAPTRRPRARRKTLNGHDPSPVSRVVAAFDAAKPNGHAATGGHSRKFNAALYNATLETIRARQPIPERAIKDALRLAKQSTTALGGHLTRGLRLKHLLKSATGYRVSKSITLPV